MCGVSMKDKDDLVTSVTWAPDKCLRCWKEYYQNKQTNKQILNIKQNK